MRVGDLKYLPGEQRFAGVVSRFNWFRASGSPAGGSDGETHERRRAGLRFDRVRGVRTHNIRMGEADAVLSLLAVSFEPADAPSGAVMLHFSGGGAIRLDVECIEAGLADLGPAWETGNLPQHAIED